MFVRHLATTARSANGAAQRNHKVHCWAACWLAVAALAVWLGHLPPADAQPQPDVAAAARDQGPGAGKGKPGFDLHGDALPAGALARLGTVRFRCPATAVAYSPNGSLLATGGADNQIRLFDAATGKEIRRLAGYQPRTFSPPRDPKSAFDLLVDSVGVGNVTTLAFSPDGKTLASGGENIRLWQTATGKPVRQLPASAVTVAFSPDGKVLASGGGKSIRLWDVDTGKELHKWDGPRLLRSVVFSPNGKWLASGDEQATIRLWDLAKAKEIREIDMQALAESLSLAFSPDSRSLACAGAWNQFGSPNLVLDLQGRVKVKGRDGYFVLMWNVDTGVEIRKYAGLNDNFKAVAFSPDPDGTTLAASSRDGRIILWETATGKERLHILAHPVLKMPGAIPTAHFGGAFAAVPALCFTPDGKTLISAGADRTIHVWDAATAKEIGRFHAPDGAFSALALSKDGTTLVSASSDSTVLVWDLKAAANQLNPQGQPKVITFGS